MNSFIDKQMAGFTIKRVMRQILKSALIFFLIIFSLLSVNAQQIEFINYKSSLEINLQNQLRELGINEDRELTSQELSNLADILRVTMNNFYYGNPARLISIARSANAPTISTLTSLGWSNIGENKWKKLE